MIFPVTFERSVTMFLLKTINSKNGINKNDLEKILINDYIKKNKALEKRLIEQKEIDFLRVKKNKVFITDQGKKFLDFSRLIKKIYGLK